MGGGGQLAKYTKEHLLNELNRRCVNVLLNPTPRELMAMLKRYGYEGELKYTEIKIINLKDID